MQTTPLTEAECEVIEDIKAVCARCGLRTDVRPVFKRYRARGGRFDAALITALGGWIAVCEKGGMLRRMTPKIAKQPEPEVDLETIAADVRRVAEEMGVKQGGRLPCSVYLRRGIYGTTAISGNGGWIKISSAAGVPSKVGGNSKPPRRRWQKSKSDLTGAEANQILNRALDRQPAAKGLLRMVGTGRCRGPSILHTFPMPQRDEVIADIRAVAMSLGLSSFGGLSFATYRDHGGQYSYEQTAGVGGFDSLCRTGGR